MIPHILEVLKRMGYAVFTAKRPYDLNIIGIRSRDMTPDVFNDLMMVVYRDEYNLWHCDYFPITTDPGLYFLENPSRVEGTAILCEGQYRSVWKLGLHRGKYEALVQTGNQVRVYRDSNRDDVLDLDPDSVMEGWFGINCHASSQKTKDSKSLQVGKWSAGCQVHATKRGFDAFMALCHKQVEAGLGDSFTYTLIRQDALL